MNQEDSDTIGSRSLNADTLTTTPLPAIDQDSNTDTNVDNSANNSSDITQTSAIPRPNFSPFQYEMVASDQDLDIHSTSPTLTSATPRPNTSSTPSSLSVAKSSKLILDALVYDAIIQNDIPGLAKILSENPNYYLNLPIRISDIGRLENDEGNTDNDIHGDDKTPLMIAASLDYVDVVKYLLKNPNVNVDLQDEQGETALFQAAAAGNAEVVRILLKNYAMVDLSNNQDLSPLSTAAYHGHTYVCRMLLDRGKASINKKDKTGKTALAHAAHRGHAQTVETLMSREADSNIADKFGWTPMMLAAYTGRANIVRRLLLSGADRSPKTTNGKTAADLARDSGFIHVADMIDNFTQNTLWVYISWVVTAPFLDRILISIGGMDDARTRQAWREKVTMCFFIALASLFIALVTFGFVRLACTELPPVPNSSVENFWSDNSSATNSRVMIVRGKIYNVGDYFALGFHRPLLPNNNDNTLGPIINSLFGKDVSQFFPLNNRAIGCRFAPSNRTNNVLCPNLPQTDSRYHCHSSGNSLRTLESLSTNRYVGISWDEISGKTGNRKLLVFNNLVYDFTSYLDPSNTDYWLGDNGTSTKLWIQSLIGLDATKEISKVNNVDVMNCFENFRVGKVEGIVYGCAAMSTVVIVLTTITTLFGIMKLFSALAFSNYISKKIIIADKKPYDQLRRIVILIPCYSEGKEGLKMSLDSLSATDYSDQHKLFFVVADGEITGSGETRSTPDILKDLITPYDDIDRPLSNENTSQNPSGTWKEPTPRSYIAIGQGTKRHNMAQVYTGYYVYENRRIPTILVVKCGTPAERKTSPKPGNRGKRDSQLVLMNLLSKAYYNEPMTELEFELFEKIRLISGSTIDQYELMCMVDADTIVEERSLSMLVACMDRDPRVIGICGETQILNKTDNWVTMIQNLLLLGEDRYLTTLILRAFPNRKTIYCPAAVCLTAVPTSFSVLLSQRRRWINGTVHNLLELIMAPELPGRFCCSMQFVAFLDFLGTVTTPFATFYLFSLILLVLFGKPFGLQIAYSAVTYLVQFVLVIFTSYSPVYVMWFLIYAVSTPLWFAVLPLYAFWNFDDFTWGTTRKIEGVDNGHDEDTIFDKFDPRKIELKKWDEWIIFRHLHNLPMLAPLQQFTKSNAKSKHAPKSKSIPENEGEVEGDEVSTKDESRSSSSQTAIEEEKVISAHRDQEDIENEKL
ncbi:15919_t:CDS:2 [Acaulospora colombiana]|uniref:15919_t:CDS:1 n=1 Tax=Acaulospora colombiana TaxID=27376 RepID=A0ACA9KRR7_9GLOM|nr:15919_t:CDS:2 [Acaulospora colombiana]